MSDKTRIAIITEGNGGCEKAVINSIKKTIARMDEDFIQEYEFLTLPVGKNIYALWKEIKDDEDLDVIEVLRDLTESADNILKGLDRNSFAEVYLFFDYDNHQNNLTEYEDPVAVVQEMLDTFDNETEQGKLYISYPMAEAVRDYIDGTCHSFTGRCFFDKVDRTYKRQTGDNNPNAHYGYEIDQWVDILNCYLGRISCLKSMNAVISIEDARKNSPRDLYELQCYHEQICKISAFPEFILDYYKPEMLKNLLIESTFSYDNCKESKQ